MFIQTLVDNNQIEINGYSPTQKQLIIDKLQALFDGSPLHAQPIFNKLLASTQPLVIQYEPNKAEVPGLGNHIVKIDPAYVATLVYITEEGIARSVSLERALMHEIVHAVEGKDDPVKSLTGGSHTSLEDYQGETVILTNKIMSDLGELDRLTYSGLTSETEIPLNRDYTFGNDVDVVLLATELGVSPNNNRTTQPGPNPDTASNTSNVHDLLIGGGGKSSFSSGMGNDFIYAGGGDDTLHGGSGNDYLNGESGTDTVTYSFQPFSADGLPDSGIYADISGANFTVVDRFGGIDSVVNVEIIIGSGHDDIFEISGNFSDIAQSIEELNADGLLTSLEKIGDTLNVSTTASVNVDLLNGTITGDGQSITIAGFENVIGTAFNDTITGNAENNIIDGGGGGDVIDGGEGADVVHFDPGSGGVTINLATGTGSGGDAAGDTYVNVEAFVGTDAADEFINGSNGQVNMFAGGGGAEHIMIVDVPNLTEENFC